jgi:uncharacterized DUF497 family protein
MEFEFDPAKSQANKAKHGIDFEEAKAIWKDDNRFEALALGIDEPRHGVIGMIGEKHWAAVVTYRSHVVRIISVRRARDLEIECYEG